MACVVLVLTLGLTLATNAFAAVNRILIIGDSWAQAIWDNKIMQNVTGVGVLGADTAIGGTTAALWASNFAWSTPMGNFGQLDKVALILQGVPTVDIVYISLSGNDMWGTDNGGWTNGMDPAVWAQHKAVIKANMLTVINFCLAQRPNIRVLIQGYDYINLWDTVLQGDAADFLLWQFLGSPNPGQINAAFADMGLELRAIAAANPSRVAYVANFGLMQWWKNTPAGAPFPGTIASGYNPYPGGFPDWPTPLSALAGTSSNRDAIHLSPAGYNILVQNCYLQVIQDWINNPLTPDTTPPVITLLGSNPVSVVQNTAYVDAGATASDNVDGNITSQIVVTSTVNTAVIGSYTVTYNASDAAGNAAVPVTRTVNVVAPPDTTPPVITLLGSNPVFVTQFTAYVDAGATASDNVDGNITSQIVVTGSVNTSIIGSSVLTYNVSDAAGNAATPVTRTVTVVEPPDTTPPAITMLGVSPVTVTQNSVYTDAGATASDNKDGDITSQIAVTSTVNTAAIGSYTVTYNVSDAAGNAATPVVRAVNVVAASSDTTKPVITLIGSSSITLQAGAAYVDPGATAMDNVDGDITSSIVVVNPVNTYVLGTYYVTYDVTDAAGNAAVQKKRTVKVIDTKKPVITLVGGGITLSVFSPFSDPGATAIDNLDGDITANIVVTGSVDPNVVGTYYLYYNVSDSMGNVAAQKIRTVKIVDKIKPVLTMLGTNPMTLNVLVDAYTEPGATAMDNYDGDLTASVVMAGSVDPNVVGTYYITYTVKDSSNNTATAKRTIKVVDKVKPVITMLGATPITLRVGAVYVDAGATAMDNYDGDITANIVATSTVNTAAVGTYTVKYAVKDSSNNSAAVVTRTVKVIP